MKIKLMFSTVFSIALLFFVSCNPKDSSSFSVGFVTDIGGIDDKSFNQGTWEGIERFTGEQKLPANSYTYLQSSTDADYIPNLSTLADNGASIVVAAGFLFVDAVAEVSKNFPDTHFLIIDSVVSDRDNVVSAVFNEEQGSFLAGVVAAKQAQKDGVNKIGFIGGLEFDVIHRFEAGFEAGIKTVDPSMELIVEYAGDFASPQIGQVLAAKIYDAGATIIFNVAGATGNGGIKEAKDRALNGNGHKKVWAIGVDRDQYDDGIYEGDHSVILTSMVKRVDIASHDVVKKAYNGDFSDDGSVITFNLANGGVSLPTDNPNVSDDILAEVEKYKEQIIKGNLKVPQIPTRLQ